MDGEHGVVVAPECAAPGPETKRPERSLRDRAVWRMAGHGGWVMADELAAALKCQEVEAAAVLVALRDAGVAEARTGAGWRLAGPALAREALRELVRRAARDGARRFVLSRVEGVGVQRMGFAQVHEGGPEGGGLGFVLFELLVPLPAGADALARLQAMVERWIAAMTGNDQEVLGG